MSGNFNLTQSLVQKLGSSIVRGELPAGKSLPVEAELGKKFGASRTVMREAVKILSTKGLIGQRPRVGTYVHPEERWDLLDAEVLTWILDRHFSHSLVREFLEVRLGIEPAAAALAAANATAEDKELLRGKLEKMKGAIDGHFDAVAADIAFHATILKISHNRFYHQLTPIIETALRFSIRLTNKTKGALADYDAHEKIYRAIRNGNADAASRACRELIAEALALVIKSARSR
ncbi:MAG TPA: FadR/GntR family transcriptional regulator [Steroidobacteraceae bacterium]|jgi:DNA-binding FadR family transcriptional regulator|nr:FadR/GntR family transcriptional regulator [Steroidobacteraceae bacterium]